MVDVFRAARRRADAGSTTGAERPTSLRGQNAARNVFNMQQLEDTME